MQLRNLFSIILVLALAISCKKKSIDTDNLFKFKDYINYTTSGRVSILSTVDVNLTKEVEGWITDEEIHDAILSISPKIEGKLVAKNASALVFVPNNPLKPNTEYAVTLKLTELYPNIPSEFKNYTFRFKTIKPNNRVFKCFIFNKLCYKLFN